MLQLPSNPSIGIAIPTWRAKKHLARCLAPFLQSPLRPRILVVDSSSDDGTIEIAEELGVEIRQISKQQFNHGATREFARHQLGTDIIVMVTQDCYAEDRHMLQKLVNPLIDGRAAIAYARQRPHHGAGFLEAFARNFNYPEESQLRGIEDLSQYGVYTFFCSNSCAAYNNHALDAIGGFRQVLLGEDTLATVELLQRGYKIAYVAEALVRHSHRYSLGEEFRRSFDTGLARRRCSQLLKAAGGDQRRGLAYVRALSRQLLYKKPHLLPYAALQSTLKWLGYQLGKRSLGAPLWLKRKLSSQKFYWQ